jgi:hypothetical protein
MEVQVQRGQTFPQVTQNHLGSKLQGQGQHLSFPSHALNCSTMPTAPSPALEAATETYSNLSHRNRWVPSRSHCQPGRWPGLGHCSSPVAARAACSPAPGQNASWRHRDGVPRRKEKMAEFCTCGDRQPRWDVTVEIPLRDDTQGAQAKAEYDTQIALRTEGLGIRRQSQAKHPTGIIPSPSHISPVPWVPQPWVMGQELGLRILLAKGCH